MIPGQTFPWFVKDVSIEITKVDNLRETVDTTEYVVPIKDLASNTWYITAGGINAITALIGQVNINSVSIIFPRLRIPLNRLHGKECRVALIIVNWYSSCACARVNHIGILCHTDMTSTIKSEVKDDISQYYEIENLGTSCMLKCSGCECGVCTYGNKRYTFKKKNWN